MDIWRRIVAWWLLVLLIRVVTPESAVLLLHFHQHTDDTLQTSQKAKPAAGTAVLSAEHQHCHVEQLFNTPFQAPVPVALPAPVRLLAYAKYRPQAPICRAAHLLDGASLRGPPALLA